MGVITAAREVAFLAGLPLLRKALVRRDFEMLARLWRNPSAADPEFLSVIWESAIRARGPILECGSGLTTLILKEAAEAAGVQHVTLEHDSSWLKRNRLRLNLTGKSGFSIQHAPLRNYGEFEWYDVSDLQLPGSFNIVVCDGPPSTTRGGRYGLLPVLSDRLAGASVLLDDAHREGEKRAISKWQVEFDAEVSVVTPPGQKTYAWITVGERL